MAEGYCWVCDAPVDADPCSTCGTAQYARPPDSRSSRPPDEVLDTSTGAGPSAIARNPVVIAAVVVAAIVVLVLVFQAGAGIS